jgi:hypothetical protein
MESSRNRSAPSRWTIDCAHRAGLRDQRQDRAEVVRPARVIRGPVVGRRNHFGSKSRQGTAVAATLYSLVETAKLHDVDPARYLREAILAADRGEVLLPWQLTR